MEKDSFIFESKEYCLSFFGEKDYHSWTRTAGNDFDGEYEVDEWTLRWKGLLELTCKTKKKFFQIHFETFTVKRYYSYQVPDQSLKGMLLHFIKKPFDHELLVDFIAQNILQLIERRKSEKDQGLLGVTVMFSKNLFDESLLLSKGILADSDGQMRIATEA